MNSLANIKINVKMSYCMYVIILWCLNSYDSFVVFSFFFLQLLIIITELYLSEFILFKPT